MIVEIGHTLPQDHCAFKVHGSVVDGWTRCFSNLHFFAEFETLLRNTDIDLVILDEHSLGGHQKGSVADYFFDQNFFCISLNYFLKIKRTYTINNFLPTILNIINFNDALSQL